MKMKAVFVADTRSLYYGIRNKFQSYSLNYLDLIKKLEDEYNLIFTYKFAYGKYEADKSFKFNTLLVETGFKVFFDRRFYDAELALKAASAIPNVDAVVLASCWHGHFPVLEYAKSFGKLTYVVGVDLPHFVKYTATAIEIDMSLLRKKDVPAPVTE